MNLAADEGECGGKVEEESDGQEAEVKSRDHGALGTNVDCGYIVYLVEKGRQL